MILRITQYGEPILRRKGQAVETFDLALRQFVSDMVETMHEAEGIGLAAQQVDSDKLIFVVDIGFMETAELDYELDGKKPPIDLIMPMVFINPEISYLPGRQVKEEEGCLSFPGIRGNVPRSNNIALTFQDIDGATHHIRASGWFARVIQHEYDHLQGVLFIDRMEAQQLRNLEYSVKKLKKATRDWMAKLP